VILLDTNVAIYASDVGAVHHAWASRLIARAASSGGAALNAVSVAELCVGSTHPSKAIARVRLWRVTILDIPAAAAEVSASAYRTYRKRRRRQSALDAPITPLPDCFIGAHAEVMGYSLATADASRFRTYFPKVPLITP